MSCQDLAYCYQVSKLTCPCLQVALDLTEAQKQDILHLRNLFYGKLSALATRRRELLHQVPADAAETSLHASSRLADIMSIAQQLQDNSVAEFKVFMQLSSAYSRGVSLVITLV